MRCAQNAGGHAPEPLRPGPFARPDHARTLAGNIAERAPERTQAAPARVEGDLGDGQVGVAEQRRRPLDASCEQITVRRYAEGLLERSREMGLGHAAHPREPLDGPLFVRSGVHSVLRAQQAAQQLGVLVYRIFTHGTSSLSAAAIFSGRRIP